MIAKIKRIRGGLFLVFSKPASKNMGLKKGMEFHFHLENKKVIATPVTKRRVFFIGLNDSARKACDAKRASNTRKFD